MITSVEKANFPATDQYLRNFSFLIDVSKVVGRIIRFNFSVQSAQLRVASLHQEAMLSTLDSWTASLIKEAKQCLTQANPKQQQFEIIKQLILHTLLILLHQPYVDHSVPNNNGGPKRNGESRYSFDICTYSAMIITQVAFDLSQDDLQYMMKRSPVLYTLITAMRVHLMNASYTADQESATHGEFSFLQSLAVMKRIQAAEQQLQMNMARNQQEVSLLTRTMNVLEKHFHARPEPILSNYANCQAQIMQSMPFPAISILSMQSTPNNASPSYEQFLTEASTPSSSSTSLSPGGMAGSTSVLFMDTSGNNNNESMNIFNDQMGDAQQGDISLQRTPPVSRPSGKGSGSNKHKKFIAYTATGASSSGGVKGPTSRLHKDTKQQPQPQPQQQLQTASSPFQHNNFNFIQDTASTTSAEQQQPALQYPEAAMSENRMMQQDPPEVQLSQQQQHHHHHHHHHQSQPQPQPQQQQFHPYQDQNHGLYHQHNHSIHQEHQNPPSSTQHEVYNPLPTPATTSTTDTSYFSPEIQQLIEQNPNILVRASQAAAAMVSQGAGLQYPQGPQSDTTSMYFDPMIQMFSNEPASSSGALTNTMVTMTTQVSNTNFNPVISVPSAGMIPSSGNENLQAYFFPSPYHNNI
ncbi:hypothetical protein BDA99DRAFT_186061 [Phascolomyces articulosus]|uniref:Uncharacterized protein n=1 Tax=Phascolomyces articulosus TaxID=60185 RepID=A0AAD5JST1_9FUNG|nr:hypothetical protein BDA99DRAFT_186061 [Phascolomyces articulosus]